MLIAANGAGTIAKALPQQRFHEQSHHEKAILNWRGVHVIVRFKQSLTDYS